ncbi:MAG: DUF1614 domain-containing protein [Candidatus Bathyarchaeia archaeon]
MSRKTIYFPHNFLMFAVLVLVLIVVVGLIFIGVVGTAFMDVGLSPAMIVLILVGTFVGSYVNIPVVKLRTTRPITEEEYVNFFGVVFRIPKVGYGEATTMVAINVGGAVIPSLVSFYLLWRLPSIILYAVVGIVVVALVTHAVARPVKGVGITTPFLVPPIVAALLAYVLPSGAPKVIAYVSGVLGTLIGADLSNLNVIPKLGAPVASIGGAGTFDGVFLSGIIAVLLA